ncbi:MAG TPA: carboxypeptidase regulatory-like domain-containing protein [Candidatus Sulfotelmatobacter sp.]|nr:carboxypeptidase regulatory-like domain-containing protein [Candidatus Sulfotelmatobacter sp.]
MKSSLLRITLAIAGLTAMAFAQAGRGTVSGIVTDPGGAVVSGAQVALVNNATGVTQHTTTTSAGLYTFISLNPGVYKVTASQQGFASTARDKISVTVDQTTEVDITLQVGAVTETVTVTQGVDLVEPTSSTVGTLIPSEAIDRVPLLYRNVFDLVQLSAGVVSVNGSPNSSDSFQSVQNISVGRPGVDVSADTFNGSLVGSVYYMLDGSPLGIAENNSAAIIPAMNIPEDGVQEVRVETQNTPASYQSGGAGVISLVSKSGGNQLHGDVFGVFRPNALSSNEFFNKQIELSQGQKNSPPDFHRYQEGGAIGGPIKKDKLFFFADYEDTQQTQFEGVDFFFVPTKAERTGDFSNLLKDPSCVASPASCQIFDPTLPDVGGVRQAFPGNIIPNPNPIALKFLANMPLCNIPDPVSCEAATTDAPVDAAGNPLPGNFGLPGLDPFKAHRFDIRVDWAKSEKQRIFTRFSYDHIFFTQADVFPAPGWDPNYAQNTTNGRNILVADDLTLNSSTVLNLRYSFTRHHEVQQGQPSYNNVDITNLGTINGQTAGFPASLAAQQVIKQLPIIAFNDLSSSSGTEGVGGTANFNQFFYASMNSDASAAVTKIHGKHQLSFGFEWMKRYLNVGQPPSPAGFYLFDITATDLSLASGKGGSDYASALVGLSSNPQNEENINPNFTKDLFAAESNPYYAAFVEDTFHASKSLTVTAGLRWDIFAGRNERFNRLEYFNPTISSSLNNVPFTGAELYVNGSNRSPFTTNMKDFSPRLGFAWQPIQHFVVRGGAGFYYGPSLHNVASAGNDTDGFSSSTLWDGTCSNLDGNTVFNGTSCGVNTGSPVDNFTVPFSLSNPFPNPPGTPGGIVPTFTKAPTGVANNFGVGLSTVLRSQRTPLTYNFNFGVEYELPHQVVVSVGYVGSRGLFLPLGNVDLNQLSLEQIQRFGLSLCVDPSLPQCQMVPNTGPVSLNPNFSGGPVPLWATLQQFPQYGNGGYGSGNGVVVNGFPGGDSEYSSLQTKVQKRLTGHFTTLATFTWGKIITDDGNPPLSFVGTHQGSAQDWRNLRFEHSISPQDVKYSFTGQASYDLPIGKGQAVNLHGVSDAILGGWTTNLILYAGTGVPIASPVVGAGTSYFTQRADLVCNPSKGLHRSAAQWVNNSCFAFPSSPFVPGTAPAYLDNVRTQGAHNLDISIYKTFKVTENKALRFDMSSYNLFNTAQFGTPNLQDLTSTSGQPFGAIGSTLNTPRQFQFGARFTF